MKVVFQYLYDRKKRRNNRYQVNYTLRMGVKWNKQPEFEWNWTKKKMKQNIFCMVECAELFFFLLQKSMWHTTYDRRLGLSNATILTTIAMCSTNVCCELFTWRSERQIEQEMESVCESVAWNDNVSWGVGIVLGRLCMCVYSYVRMRMWVWEHTCEWYERIMHMIDLLIFMMCLYIRCVGGCCSRSSYIVSIFHWSLRHSHRW